MVDPTLPLEELAEKEDEQQVKIHVFNTRMLALGSLFMFQVGYQGPTSEEIEEFLKETNFNTVAIRNWQVWFTIKSNIVHFITLILITHTQF